MLIEIIFRGLFATVDYSFLGPFILNSKEVRFNSPEMPNLKDFGEVKSILDENEYADLIINTDLFYFGIKEVSKVFINFCKNGDQIEFLIFFDVTELNTGSLKLNIDYLKSWVEDFQIKHRFSYFICQMDNAQCDEYYFDQNGLGKLYYELP